MMPVKGRSAVMKLHVDRPCRVTFVRGGWQWRCLCTPEVWPYAGQAATWAQAYRAAEAHMRLEHPKPKPVTAERLAPVIALRVTRPQTARPVGSRRSDLSGVA
jgi:hypothetical protein